MSASLTVKTPQESTAPPAEVTTTGDPGSEGEPVTFHRLSDEYGVFTNFSRHPVVIGGVVWATCEHFFQAAKFTDARHAVRVRLASTPSRAAALGRTRQVPLRRDWDTIRVEIMRQAMRAKFCQHPNLAHRLLSTGRRPLIETTPRDRFWGKGCDGTGANMTGKILHDLRTELRASSPPSVPVSIADCGWVAFGDDVIAVPWTRRPRADLAQQAATMLLDATTHLPTIQTAPGSPSHFQASMPGRGHVLLHTNALASDIWPSGHPVTAGAVAGALVRAATHPITWVHDPRWPR